MTFWGEIDRQYVLTDEDPDVGRRAVRQVAEHLYDPKGGLIAQFEFGAATVRALKNSNGCVSAICFSIVIIDNNFFDEHFK